MSWLDRHDRERAPSHIPIFDTDGRFGALDGSRRPSAINEAPASGMLEDGDRARPGHVGLSVKERRLAIAFLAPVLLLAAVVVRAGQFQLADGGTYRSRAEGNRSRIEWLPSERGIIYDRNGIPLVDNVPAFTLTLTPSDLPREESARREVIAEVAEILDASPMDIEERIDSFGRATATPVTIHEGLTHEQSVLLTIASQREPAIAVHAGMRRSYRYTESAGSLAHLLGYQGKISPDELAVRREDGYLPTDIIGKTGLERQYELALRGTFGRRRIEVDAAQRQKTVIAEEAPVPGASIVLSIDLELQEAAQTALDAALARTRTRRGSVIVLRPATGEVLAMVNAPHFDNNLFAQGISTAQFRALNEDPDHPLFTRAISASLASGSVFKPIVAAAALEERIVTPITSFLSTGGLRIGQWVFPDWRAGGHGATNLAKALADSVNTYFYIVGGGLDGSGGLGVERIVDYARRFGLGARLGIDLPGEGAGFLPSMEWKERVKGERWYVGDTYHVSIGQGDILVTPLQIATMTAAIANGGALPRPHLVNAITTPDGQRTVLEPEIIDPQVVSRASIEEVRKGMRQAVTLGSARSLSFLPVAAAGKTGTAQWSSQRAPHAWFTSFAPYDNPELVITVVIEEGVEGSTAAAPVARDIYAWYYGNR